MRKLLLLAVLCAVLLSGCSSFSSLGSGLTGHAANPSAAPDRPTTAETTAGGAASTREARLAAGLSWLWQCVARLRDLGVASGSLDELAGLAGDMERLAGEGQGAAAVEVFNTAWALAVRLGSRS